MKQTIHQRNATGMLVALGLHGTRDRARAALFFRRRSRTPGSTSTRAARRAGRR